MTTKANAHLVPGAALRMVGIISLDLHRCTEWMTFIGNFIFQKRNLRPRRVRYPPKVGRLCHMRDLPTKPLSPQLPLTLDVLRLSSLLPGPHSGREAAPSPGSLLPRMTLPRMRVQCAPEPCPPAAGYSHETEDGGASEAQEQEEGQGAQDGRDDDHAAAPPARPRVDRGIWGD